MHSYSSDLPILLADDNKIGDILKQNNIEYIDERNNLFSPCKIDLGESYDSDDEIIDQDIRKLNLNNIRKKKRKIFSDTFFKQIYYNYVAY